MSQTQTAPAPKAPTALEIAQRTVTSTEARVNELIRTGRLNLPSDYSAGNAIRAAWLVLQDAETKDKKPVLSVVTQASLANALLNMCVLGLNPAKSQCYFIPYGNRLVCQPSYMGRMAIAMRVDPTIEDIAAEVVYDGDEFQYEIKLGRKLVTKHVQSISNVAADKIVAAYCTVIREGGSETSTVMTIDEIHSSWRQSRMSPFDDKGHVEPSSTHGRFPAEMAKRTVIAKALKPVINASSDAELLRAALNEVDDAVTDAYVDGQVVDHANSEELQIPEAGGTPETTGPAPADHAPTAATLTEETKQADDEAGAPY